MSNFLAAYPNLTGYWTQDGMAIGALQAVMAANPAVWPQGVGEGRCQFLRLWQEAVTMNPRLRQHRCREPSGRFADRSAHCSQYAAGQESGQHQTRRHNGLSFVLPLASVVTNRTTWRMVWRCAKASPMRSCSMIS